MRRPPLTLRSRLALWHGCTVLVALVIFAGALYGVVASQLVQHHDESLRAAATQVARIISRDPADQLTANVRAELDAIGPVMVLQELDAQVRVSYQSPTWTAFDVPIDSPKALPSERPRFESMMSATGLQRVYSEPTRGTRGTIRVARGLGDVHGVLAVVRLGLLLLVPLAIVISAAGGYWLAARALAPVEEATRAVNIVGARNGAERAAASANRDEIGRLVESCNEMIARVDASFERMKRFTSDAAHELRAPLTRMRAAIDVVLSRPRMAREYRQVLCDLREDVDGLTAVASDLLVLATAEADRLRLDIHPVRFDVIATDVVRSVQRLAAGSGVSLRTECPVPVVVAGDERWLRHLVSNLVDNAVKFTASSRSSAANVWVELRRADQMAVLRVIDSGPGVPEEALPHVFERFYRVDRAADSQPQEGSGLGLPIAAWIAHAHGGNIAVENRPTGGSIFSVTLPMLSTEVKSVQRTSDLTGRRSRPAIGLASRPRV